MGEMSNWRHGTLGDFCKFQAGSVFPKKWQGKRHGAYPFIKVSDMNLGNNSIYIENANNWVDGSDLPQLKAQPFPPNTTVFAKIGEALKQNRFRLLVRPTLIDNNLMGAIPNQKFVDPQFFYYAFSRFNLAKIAGGTALPYLTIKVLSSLKFPVPPLLEQRKIGEILRAWDEEIAEIDALRTAWVNQKRGLIQALLSGNHRFAEFKNQPRRTLLFGDCAALNKKMVVPSNFEGMPYVGLEHISEKGLSQGGNSSKISSEKMLFKCGDILFGKLRPYLRKIAHASFDGICSTDIWVVRAKKGIDQRFLFYCMASTPLINFAISSSEGTRMPRAKWNYLARYKLAIPSIPEQRKIAAALETWDEAIEKLHALRVAKINQKRGLMQKLLTGKIRVKT